MISDLKCPSCHCTFWIDFNHDGTVINRTCKDYFCSNADTPQFYRNFISSRLVKGNMITESYGFRLPFHDWYVKIEGTNDCTFIYTDIPIKLLGKAYRMPTDLVKVIQFIDLSPHDLSDQINDLMEQELSLKRINKLISVL